MQINCYAISLNGTQNLHFSKNSGKNFAAKIILMLSFKVTVLHTNFCTIPFFRIRDRSITRILSENGLEAPPTEQYMYKNYIIFISNDTYFVYTFLCNFIQ